MKYCLGLFLIFILLLGECFAQDVELRGGGTAFPGIYAAMRYEHYSNSMINVAGGVFLESSFRNQLAYSAKGIDLLAQYKSGVDDSPVLSWKAGFGATAECVSEPWVYKELPFSKRLNYGILAELAGIIHLTEVFGLSVFAQQKFFFNPDLGKAQFALGLGLSYHFSN